MCRKPSRGGIGCWRASSAVLIALLFIGDMLPAWADESESPSRLSDKPTPLDKTLERPKPLVELGVPFLGTGKLQEGFTLPGGAVWQPSFVLFGTYRTAVQTFDDGKTRFSEWANRLDIFGNIQLSGTERILIGLRPLDNHRQYFGYEFEPKKRFSDNGDGSVEMLFFEGEFGEIFPNLDLYDRRSLDYGFSVGRQPLLLQDGLLLNDRIDSLGIVRNSLHTPWTSGWRVDFLYGWNYIHRNNNERDNSAQLFALSTSADWYWTTVDLDAVYLDAKKKTGSAVYGGLGATQRVNLLGRTLNSTFRVVGSQALDQETPETSDGVLFFTELGLTPHGGLNWLYLNAFWGIERFSSAARAPDAGGPLGRVGVLFEALGLGRYQAALGNRADDSAGGALGYQMFFDQFRRQLTLEVGGRKDTNGTRQDRVAFGGRLEQAIGHHFILRFDSFISTGPHRGPGYGGRTELMAKF